MGDSYELHIRYFLAKYVFVRLAYQGWVGLGEHALEEKCEPFKKEVREHWKRLKVSDEYMSTRLHPFVKQKWCDTMYFLAQDHDMENTADAAVMLTRMAVRAHVRITCSRGGSFAKDWWDRAGVCSRCKLPSSEQAWSSAMTQRVWRVSRRRTAGAVCQSQRAERKGLDVGTPRNGD